MKFWLIVFLFLFISALVIVSNNNLHLKSVSEAKEFASLYYSWLLNTAGDVIKVTGYVVGFEWLPGGNSTATNSTGMASNISNSS